MAGARLIGLLGGTFDPVHFGHLRPADTVRRRLGLDALRLVPCRQPAHRDAPIADADQRVAMLERALEAFPDLTLETCELDRPGPSYAVDTLAELHRREPDANWCWLMGADAFQSFTRWHRWRRILEQAHLAVMTRPGCRLEGEAAQLLRSRDVGDDRDQLRGQPAGAIVLLDVESPDISATQVRRRLGQGRPVAELVPAAVADYLQTNPIYSQTTESS